MKTNIAIIIGMIFLLGCAKKETKTNKKETKMLIKTLNLKSQKVRDYVKKNVVIAHRGSTYWTPEETEPAYRWARNIGADYLELDLQLTKDNKLVAFHDDDLKRTTNITEIFPKRKDAIIHDFTLAELRKLDVGSWFNQKNKDRANDKFVNLKILTLKDIIKIAEGNKLIKELKNGKWTGNFKYTKDPSDNGNRPGIYVETKHPKSNIEKYLAQELIELGWNINTNPKQIKTENGKIEVANTNARLILQSFSPKSILQLEKYLPNIPKCFLLWKPDMKGDLKENYIKAINFAVENNVHIIGPSIAGEPNNYEELTDTWMTDLIHQAKMSVHSYTFDTNEQLQKYTNRIDAVFTNRADLAIQFYNSKAKIDAKKTLKRLGY